MAVPPLVPRIPPPKYYAVKVLSLRKIAPYAANTRPIHNAETNIRIVLDADKRIWQAERNAFLIIQERPVPLRCASQILPDEVEHSLILEVNRQLIQQQQVVDGGVVGFRVGSQHEAIVRQMVADLSHGILRTVCGP